MKKKELISLYQGLNQLGSLSGVKFAYAITRNISYLKPEIEALEKAIAAPEEYKTFDNLRVKLLEKYSKKDKAGKAVITNNNYDIEDQVVFDKAFEKLKKEHKGVFEAREKQIKDYVALLDEEATVSFHKIKQEDIPANITVAQMNTISRLIIEE